MAVKRVYLKELHRMMDGMNIGQVEKVHPRKVLKYRQIKVGNESVTYCNQLKLMSA